MSYLSDAKRFYEEAVKELERGIKEGSDILIRNAAEKGWNAIVQATNYLMEKKGLPVPENHRQARLQLAILEREDPCIEALGLRDRYMARFQTLHSDCFYQNIWTIEGLRRDLEKVKAYIEDIEKILNCRVV